MLRLPGKMTLRCAGCNTCRAKYPSRTSTDLSGNLFTNNHHPILSGLQFLVVTPRPKLGHEMAQAGHLTNSLTNGQSPDLAPHHAEGQNPPRSRSPRRTCSSRSSEISSRSSPLRLRSRTQSPSPCHDGRKSASMLRPPSKPITVFSDPQPPQHIT